MAYIVSSLSDTFEPTQIVDFPFAGSIRTNAVGYQSIASLYKYITEGRNQTIRLNWKQLDHFDANLSALLLALIKKAEGEHQISFLLDEESLAGRHDVFVRNGLSRAIHNTPLVIDERRSTIPVKRFTIDEVDAFAFYVEKDLFRHRSLKCLPEKIRQQVGSHFFELFCNVEIHAGTNEIFACGQFFPKKRELIFTLVDMGCGFLKNIMAYTEGSENIDSALRAIQWAVTGGSTKRAALGGSGLKKILSYCVQSGNSLQISTDGCYWVYDPKQSNKPYWQSVANSIGGTTISMIFRNL